MNTSEVLNRAADLIESRGWATGGSNDPWGEDAADAPLCLEGGIIVAAGVGGETGLSLLGVCPAARAVHDYLALSAKRTLWHWNDDFAYDADGVWAPARTAEQVVEVLRAAAVIEQARESEPSSVRS